MGKTTSKLLAFLRVKCQIILQAKAQCCVREMTLLAKKDRRGAQGGWIWNKPIYLQGDGWNHHITTVRGQQDPWLLNQSNWRFITSNSSNWKSLTGLTKNCVRGHEERRPNIIVPNGRASPLSGQVLFYVHGGIGTACNNELSNFTKEEQIFEEEAFIGLSSR